MTGGTMSTHRILVVDDEPEVRSVLRRGLESEHYEVVEAGNAAKLFRVFAQDSRIDLVTLDLTLGQDDGMPLAAQLRAIRNVPIVMITARVDPLDRVSGLEQGADDYVVKPFHIREVLLRIRAVLRRYELEQPEDSTARGEGARHARFSFAAGILDQRHRLLNGHDGAAIALTDAEYDVLALLLEHPGRVLSRDDIMLRLKGRKWTPLDRTIDGVIARLRKKIEPDIAAPVLIRTVWGVGYAFSGDVDRLPPPAA